MASRYYNPRLAQKVGAAEAPMYSSISGAVEKGRIAYERETAKQLQKKQIEMQQRQAEAAAFKKEMERRDDILYNISKQQEKISKPIDLLPAQLKGVATALAEEAKMEYFEIQKDIQKGLLTKGQAAIKMENGPNTKINKINGIISGHGELIEDANFKTPSVVNDSKSLKITNKLIEGNYTVNKDGEIVIMDDDNKTILQKIPLSEANKVNYIEEDTEGFYNAFVSLNSAMDSAAKSGKRWESAEREINLVVDQLNFTPEQSLSIAFDYLGKTKPEYASLKDYQNEDGSINIDKFKNEKVADLDGDGKIGDDDDLNIWVKNQLKQAAKNSYDGYKKDYADKFEAGSELTQTQKYNEEKAAKRGDILIKKLDEGVQSFITSISPSTEFRDVNGLVTLLNRDEDGKVVEGQRYNTNTIEGREAFLNDFARAKYGSDAQFDLIQDYIGKTLRNTMVEETGPSPTTKPQLP